MFSSIGNGPPEKIRAAARDGSGQTPLTKLEKWRFDTYCIAARGVDVGAMRRLRIGRGCAPPLTIDGVRKTIPVLDKHDLLRPMFARGPP